MKKSIVLLISLFFFSPLSHAVSATPWFTGPILAPAGHTIPRGHTNFEMYGLDVYTNGQFNDEGVLKRSPLFKTFVANPVLTHGFTDWMDVQWVAPYVFNDTQNRTYSRLGDVSVTLGFQVLEQKKSCFKTDLRLSIQETIPSGRFENLNPFLLGTDSTGLGSYQTQLGLNFQRLFTFTDHFLRTRFILSGIYFSPVHVHGINSFGGAPETEGTVGSSYELDADLAFEYTMTKHWVAVMEGYVSKGNASLFTGFASFGNINAVPINVGSGAFFEAALAPAIEYNFTSNAGLIGGVWFPVRSRNASEFITYVLALNVYW